MYSRKQKTDKRHALSDVLYKIFSVLFKRVYNMIAAACMPWKAW